MRILITAGNGQLGTDATSFFSKKYDVVSYKDVELDITDEKAVADAVQKVKPDIIFNMAAITNVDGCEQNQELAYRVNTYGAGVLAKAADDNGAILLHISTDYVFDGTSQNPYHETDAATPQSVYGKSKHLGEQEIMAKCSRYFILRTAWLYGPHGNNFVKTMLKFAAEKGEVSVVTDQFGNPTSTFELVRIIDHVVNKGKFGVYHATCEGVCSWNAFAREIFKFAGLNVAVNDVTSENFVRPAKRPAYSNLSKDKLFLDTGYRPADWHDALKEYFDYNAGTIDF